MDCAGLGWMGLFDGRESLRQKTKDETDKTDWTEGIEALSGKLSSPSSLTEMSTSAALFSAVFYYTSFFYGSAVFFLFSLTLYHFLFAVHASVLYPKVPFSIAGPTMNGYFFVWLFLSRPRLVSLPIYLPTFLRPSNSAGTREIATGEGGGGAKVWEESGDRGAFIHDHAVLFTFLFFFV